jgi:F0F1-type ATP synthase membrane subunit a
MTSGFIFFFLALLPLVFIIAFSGLETGIAFIQAQVFVALTCSYILTKQKKIKKRELAEWSKAVSLKLI